MTGEVVIRTASDDDLDAYVDVWNATTPDEPSDPGEQRERREREPRRLYLLAERDGELVGCGFAGPSQSEGRGFVAPRVLPHDRRGGVGTAVLRELVSHVVSLGCSSVSSHVDGADPGSLAFAERFGFVEVDRQVEQVRELGADEPAVRAPDGLVFTTLAERPELLEESYPLAQQGYADLATFTPVTISLDDWLAGDDANFPEGSFVALAGDEVVGLSGLCRHPDGAFEDGLTVVRRDWRRRGVAQSLKRAKLAWAAANGIDRITTWTQKGNEGMRALNERLGYEYRSVSITVRASLGQIRL